MSRTTPLYDLQLVDTALDERVNRHHGVTAALNDQTALAQARSARDEAQAALTEGQVELRLVNGDIEAFNSKIAAEEKKLFGGAVKNPKELASLEHEVASLRKQKATREDHLLQVMETVDARLVALHTTGEVLAAAELAWQQRQAGLLEDKDQIETQLRALKVRRDHMITTIPWSDLQLYDRLRRAKHGMAVAAIVNNICQGCHVTVPNSVLQQVKHGHEFATCPSCTRILHMPGRGELVLG